MKPMKGLRAFSGRLPWALEVVGAPGPPYDRLIGAALNGVRFPFARQDTIEAAWSVVDPILGGAVPVHPYAQGSWGPREPTPCYPMVMLGTTPPSENGPQGWNSEG